MMKKSDYVYEPHEDSFLILKASKPFFKPGKKILDIGTGSGILAIEAAKYGCQVTASDINKKALIVTRRNARKHRLKITFVQSDLFNNINGKFDVIIFNPPYLPAVRPFTLLPKDIRLAVEGGKYGYETIIKFIKQAKKFLNKDGIIFLLFSSLTNKKVIDNSIKVMGYKKEQVAKEKMFFETIYVYKLKSQRKDKR